ncbi:hypothetical protein UFOVP1184_20 [uncultured Caudovirales phage]|uniref:Uncharacterized protein n=1 Tax=uncultured Caudovirales phage TaxID=2100421 RepID=A0A6J5QXC0_9CAUD|nr:hypothetical protein UFOVP1184_20 [uncultured Caudovirales phage]
MVSASGQAVFAVVAKDAASKVLKGVGKSFGSMKSNAVAAFKAVGAAAVAAAAAVVAFTGAAIKGAIEDERSQILTTSALKARGFAMDALGPKMEEQIKALQRFGKSDDDVRAGLEVGSRYFKNQEKLLRANATAAAISSVTGKDMATVMGLIGKAANGSTRGLAALIGPIEKNAKLTDILTQADDKYLAVANELADSTSGKMLTAQQRFNEAMDDFGAKFLPKVNEAMGWLTTNILPALETGLSTAGDAMVGVIDNLSAPGGLFESVGKVAGSIFDDLRPELDALVTTFTGPDGLFTSVGKLIGALWGDGDGALAGAFKLLGGAIEVAFALAKPFFDALKWLVDNITTVLDAMNKIGAAQTVEKGAKAAGDAGYNGGSFVNPLNAGGGTGGFTANLNVNLDGKTIAKSTDTYLGMQYSYGGSRTNP